MPTAQEITATANAMVQSGKYRKKGNQTYCNFFVRDFSASLFDGTPLPELKGRAKQQAAKMAASANWTALGFRTATTEAARQAAFDKAQELANSGTFVVAGAAAPPGTADPTYSGHVAVVVPSQLPASQNKGMVPSGSWGLRCPLIAHAGSKVFSHKGLNFGFGRKYKVNRLELYAFQSQDPPPDPTGFLGGFELRRGDNDSEKRWGGQLQTDTDTFVADLQALLNDLGFLIVGTADGDFGPRTEWAVREFQIYAGATGGAEEVDPGQAMPHARLNAISVDPADRYTGDLHARTDTETRNALVHWRDNNRRCPVVLTAFERSFDEPRGATIVRDNIWNKNDFTQSRAHVHALDFSNLFTIPDEEKDAEGYIVVGKYTSALETGMLAQPVSNHEWDGMEVLPQELIGRDTGDLTDEERATFRVIRAVSEVECYGYFDCLNAYDRGLMSAGLFHWTIGLTNSDQSVSKVDAGELGAFASYLKGHSTQSLRTAFTNVFERFGLDVAKEWGTTGKDLFVQNARKYVAYSTLSDGDQRWSLRSRRECQYLTHWHWFYRFLMSSRTSEGFQRGMWDFCRLRLRDMLTAPLRSDANVDSVSTGNGTRDATLGDVFASEKSAALLLRCHVNSPGHIISSGAASTHISEVIAAVRAEDPALVSGPPNTWTHDAEKLLIEKLLERAGNAFPRTIRDTIGTVASWPSGRRADLEAKFQLKGAHPLATPLSDERTFVRDETGLPASPAPGTQQAPAIQLVGPLLGSDEDKETGVCLVPKDDGSGELESILLQIGTDPEPMPDAVKGDKDPASDTDPPESGAEAPPGDLVPTPQAIPTFEIPVLESDPIDIDTDSGDPVAVTDGSGNVRFVELLRPTDGQPPKSFRVRVRLDDLLGTPNGIEADAEIRASDLVWTAGVPTSGSLFAELRLSGDVLPQDIVWSLATSGDLQPGDVNFRKLRVLDDGSFSFPVFTTGDTQQLPVPASAAGYTLSGDMTIGPGEVNKYRLRFDGELDGEFLVNLGSSLAQLYAESSVGIYLDTDDLMQLQFSGEKTKLGVRLDLFQEFRKSVVNNQWKSGGDSHLIRVERTLGGYGDLTIQWRNRLPEIPTALLARALSEISETVVNTGRRLESLVGNLPVRQLSTRVNFRSCPNGLVETNLVPEATSTADYDFGTSTGAGDWQLHSTWVASDENADVAPIEVFVGNRRLIGAVDQQQAPLGDHVEGGSNFQRHILFNERGDEVTEFSIADGDAVRVRIHNGVARPATGTDGGKVVADAVVLRRSDGSVRVLDDSDARRAGAWTSVNTGHDGGSHIAEPVDLADDVHLVLCLVTDVKDSSADENVIFSAEGRFKFPIGRRTGEGISISSKSFASSTRECSVKVIPPNGGDNDTGYTNSFAGLISLGVPYNTVFRFVASPGRNQFEYLPAESAASNAGKIRLRVPAAKQDIFESESERFTFELDEFKVHSGGTDLRGRVLTEEVWLGAQKQTALKKPLSVKEAKPPAEDPEELQIGEVAFQDSRLVFAQIQAAAEISYFDDGRGTFTLTVAEKDVKNWDIIADLELTGSKEFHVDKLYTTFSITGFQFSTTYNTGDDSWTSDGSISGGICFQPPQGQSSRSTGALSDLFGGGVKVTFEDWNPLDLADSFSFTIEVQPRTFDVADVLEVSLRGIEVHVQDALPDGFKLLGDVRMKNLPGIDSELTFGGIRLTPRLPVPEFTIDRIGASLSIPGSFTASGDFEHVRTDIEDGFKGAFSLDTEVLPPISGLVQITALKPLDNQGRVPSVAVYLEAGGLDVPLFAGFYLRSLGFGLGLNRGLRGLMPVDGKSVQQRLLEVVDNPGGLPSPARLESWTASRPANKSKPPLWMFVASGLITFGKFANNKPHTLSGSALLSVNYEGEIFLGVNLWLFTTPDETRRTDFQQRPAARGGILLSPKERLLFGKFRTIKNPKLNEDAPKLLSEVLDAVETSMVFQADPNGFLLQVGWPWETKIQKNIGPLKGELTSGFRFGIYRGIVSFGLNWAIRMELKAEKKIGFSTWIGSAEARFKVDGEGSLRIGFVGALDHGLKPYLLGDVRLSATIKLEVSAECRLSKKIGFVKIRLRISFRKKLELSISAALTMALDPKPELGARGTARVSVCVGRYRIGGSVDFVFNGGLIDSVSDKIDSLLPPPLPTSAGTEFSPLSAERSFRPLDDQPPQEWTYLFRRFTTPDGDRRVRVLLFPSPGAGTTYPPLASVGRRFELDVRDGVTFRGIVSGTKGVDVATTDHTIAWREHDQAVIRTAEDFATGELEGDAPNSDLAGDLTLADIMEALLGEEIEGIDLAEEVVDPRPWNPSPEHSDDPAAEIGERGMATPNLKADTPYDQDVARASGEQDPDETPHPETGGDGLQPGLLLQELVDLMHDDQAVPNPGNGPGQEADGYELAPHLQLVLEFDDPLTETESRDPVKELLADVTPFRVGGEDAPLKAIYNVDGATEDLPEYDIVTGPPAQADDRICLNWELWREGASDDRASAGRKRQMAQHYAELVEYRVTRRIVGDTDEPLRKSLQPAFLDPSRADSTSGTRAAASLVRPQFQYVDQELTKVREGDVLIYEVEAWSTDRRLSATTIAVQRRTVKVLPPLSQSLVLCEVGAEQDGATDAQLLFTVVARDYEQQARSALRDDRFRLSRTHLRVRYQIVPASTQGLYGRTPGRVGNSTWSRGTPARTSDQTEGDGRLKGFEIEFADPAQHPSIPWPDARKLPTSLVMWERVASATGDLEGFTAQVSHAELLNAVRDLDPEFEADSALQFFIGVEHGDVDDVTQSLQRSPLVRCRMAVAGAVPASPGQLAPVRAEDDELTPEARRLQSRMTRGASVDAIEHIPDRGETEFVPPNLIESSIDYGLLTLEPGVRPPRWTSNVIYDFGTDPEQLSWTLYWTWTASRSNSVKAPIEIYAGQERYFAYVDQTRPPVADLSHSGADFQKLELTGEDGSKPGEISVPGGRAVRVQVHNASDADGSVVADAVLLKAETEVRLLDSSDATVIGDWEQNTSGGVGGRFLEAEAEMPAAWTASDTNDAVMSIRWPHDDSLTGRWVPDGENEAELVPEAFNPVVGYRIHRTDVLDPMKHPIPADFSLAAEPVLTISAVSEAEYRARPATIPVVGLRRGRDDRGEFIERDWTPVDQLNFDAVLPLMPELAFVTRRIGGSTEPGGSTVAVPLPQHMSSDLLVACDAIATGLGESVFAHCQPSYPVLPNVLRPLTPSDGLLERFLLFSEAFDWKSDPCGWNAAEALGMSCECTFVKANGDPVNAEVVRELLETGSPAMPRVTPIFFQADDGSTLLNVVRLTLNRPAAVEVQSGSGPITPLDIRAALMLQLSALPRLDSQTSSEFEEVLNQFAAELGSVLTNFVAEINNRLHLSKVVISDPIEGQHGRVFAQQRSADATDGSESGRVVLSPSQARSNRGRASLRLPVRENQPLECRLPIPDRWARDYRVSIEVIRRYDVSRSLASPEAGTLQPPNAISALHQKQVLVRRTRSLGDLNIFATGLPGAVQAGIFRHVASFAATSNAEQKARGQYGPLTIYLERRIADKDKVEAALRAIPGRIDDTADPDTVWLAYNEWLRRAGHLDTETTLPLIVEPDDGVDRLHLTVPPIAQHGIYGADRYVYTDVPADYEYRICAQARAGLVRSRVARTGFVSPMFDAIEDFPDEDTAAPRMQPAVYAPDPAAADPPIHTLPFTQTEFTSGANDSALMLRLPLVFSRFHLRPGIRPLWVDAEAPVAGIPQVGFGSLPDLRLKYRVLLLENYQAVRADPQVTRVLVPLFEVTPPDLDDPATWFMLDGLPAGITHVQEPAGDARVAILQGDGRPEHGGADMLGALMFDIKLQFQEPAASGYVSVLRSAFERGHVDHVLYLSVSREGKMSDMSANKQFR